MFGFPKPKIYGIISYYNLQDWWLNTFSKEEVKRIESKFPSFTTEKIVNRNQSCAETLTNLSDFFSASDNRGIRIKFITKAIDEAQKYTSVLDLHFALSTSLRIYQDEDLLIKAASLQIVLAPMAIKALKTRKFWPAAHSGYERIAIILEKRKNYSEAINTCELAKIEGWTGDWDKRITRINNKMSKSKSLVN